MRISVIAALMLTVLLGACAQTCHEDELAAFVAPVHNS